MIERERGNIRYEIVKHIGILNTYPTGWSKEFNIVKWNDKAEKYDIRDWAPGHERMSKGITLYEDELKALFGLCSNVFVKNTSAKAEPVDATASAEKEIEPADTPEELPADELAGETENQQADKVAEDVPF